MNGTPPEDAPSLGPRTRGRRLALQFLFGADLSGKRRAEDFEAFAVQQEARGPAVDFARRLVRGTIGDWEALDQLLGSLAQNWRLDRMAATDRNVLRLGCYELLREPETPAGVVINEAVELAKVFGTVHSGGFVNGILDRVRQRRDAGDLTWTPSAREK